MADGKLKLRYIDYICSCDQMRPVMDALEKQLDADGGIQIDLAEPPPDMSGPKPTDAAAVFSHQADLGRMCSPAYCLSKDLFLPLVAPVSISDPVPQDTSDRQALVPVYYSQFYVRKDSHYNAFEDLQGSVFAFNDEMSLSGLHCARHFVWAYYSAQKSISLPFFQSLVRTGGHANSVIAVVEGRADVLALDCKVLEALLQDESGAKLVSQLRPILVPDVIHLCRDIHDNQRTLLCTVSKNGLLGPNPAQPIVASRRLDPAVRERVMQGLLSLTSEQLEPRMTGIKCYAPVDEKYYESVAAMMLECQGTAILAVEE
jgi:ABC-type phosphate/phosphonate transport system substrate-binding protein